MKKNATCWLFPSGKWWKILLIMKLKIFFLLVSLGTLQAAGYSQDSRFNLKKNDVSLTEVLQELQQQSEYRFFYQKDIFQQADRVNVDMKNVSLRQILDEVLIRHGFSYEMIDKVITIRKIQQQKTAGRKITGIVMDTRKQSLPGVTVLLKGTALGVVTDKEGRFNIEIPETDPIVLVFSFVGMKKQEVTYTGQEDIQVVMEEEVTEMDEVVITGYQVIDRKKLTSAITSVKAEDIMIPGVNSIDQMLEGRIPDLMLTTNSGEVGVVPRLRIRGTSTLVGNREPLWVVNGVVVNDPVPLDSDVLNDPDYVNRIGNAIAGLNPQDIQRIDVLKDAAATTLYGTRAANGVIVITTKKGHVGKPVVRYNMTTTYKRRPRYSDRKIDLMNSKERIDLSRELAAASYLYPSDMSIVGYEYLLQQLYAGVIDDEQFAIEVKKLENNNTDWFDILTEDAFSHNHTLSISGGTDQLRYYSSVGYTKDNDVIKGQGISRYTGNLSLESDLTKWLKASMDFNANISERNYEQSAVGSVNYAYTTSRAIAAYEEGGDLSYYQKRYNSFYRYDFNILNERANSYTKQENSGFDLTSRLVFRFTDWLNGDVLFNYAVSNADNEDYWGESTYHVACIRKSNYGVAAPSDSELPYGGELSEQNTRNKTYSLRAQLNLNKYFGEEEKHNINGALGYEMSSSRYKGYQNTSRGYYADRGKNFTSVGASDYSKYTAWVMNNQPKITDNLTNLIGAYLTLTYSYRNLFSLNANMRYDGSNKFGSRSNEKLLPVWAVSGSFNLAELPALSADWLNFLAIKMSYGYQGNMLDGQTPVLLLKNNPRDSYYNKFTSSVASYPNPELNWEKTGSFNTGLELAVLDNRIQISGDFYYKRTKDAFMNKPISNVNGLTSYTVNSGEVINRGYNISLNLVPVKTRDFKWSLSTTISKTKNKLNTRPDAEQHELSDFLNGSALVKDNR